MYTILLWNTRIIRSGEALKHLADRAGVELPKIEYSREVREKADAKSGTA